MRASSALFKKQKLKGALTQTTLSGSLLDVYKFLGIPAVGNLTRPALSASLAALAGPLRAAAQSKASYLVAEAARCLSQAVAEAAHSVHPGGDWTDSETLAKVLRKMAAVLVEHVVVAAPILDEKVAQHLIDFLQGQFRNRQRNSLSEMMLMF